MNRYILILAVALFTSAALLSCNSSDDEEDLVGNWKKRSDFEGVARSDAAAFAIGEKAYVCGGYDGKKRLSDVWEYNADKDYWTQKADFPGTARNTAVAFAINNNGYVGTGYDGENYLTDFWQYNSLTNIWTRKTDFAGSARHSAVGFAIGQLGYIGSGFNGNYLKDFWQYNPTTDQWLQKVSMGGSKRYAATAFIIDDKAYVCGGSNNGTLVTDFWQYDPVADSWNEKRQIKNYSDEEYDDSYAIARNYGVSFVINGKAYLANGENGSLLSDVWEYNPTTDLWDKKTGFEASTRTGAVAFSLNNRGFVATGRSSSYRFDDVWEFLPFEAYEEND